MRVTRPNNQPGLFDEEPDLTHDTDTEGEALRIDDRGVEARTAEQQHERPPLTDHPAEAVTAGIAPVETTRLMERICEEANIEAAVQRVRSNRGSPGVDGMTVHDLPRAMRRLWPQLRHQLLTGSYRPQPVRCVSIAKPGGGERTLGIPTVIDRVIQQAVLQVLQPEWDPTFHRHSYGFRPGRSAHQAVLAAQRLIDEGYTVVVDMDLEKFFDRVNHDVLMSRVARRVEDKRVLKLIRAYLSAGILEGGLISPRRQGTPQGGPLSPLLSNLLLDELDRELERRGLHFVRYADDCNIYLRSERAAERVFASVERFLHKRLRLRVNHAKSGVGEVWGRSFLGFSFVRGRSGSAMRIISPASRQRLRQRVREVTRRHRGRRLTRVIADLSRLLRGWKAYFGIAESQADLRTLDGWIRRRLRNYLWKQWQRPRRRVQALCELGIPMHTARRFVWRMQGIWRPSGCPVVQAALPTVYFDALGLVRLADEVRS